MRSSLMAPGDVDALHTDIPTNEAIFVEDGELEIRIGDRVELIGPDDVPFIPRVVLLGWPNVGSSELKLRAVFPLDVIAIETPATPGPEGPLLMR
jgi:mannose-6-phosphate isomerase-like protein (cupin superfamily)